MTELVPRRNNRKVVGTSFSMEASKMRWSHVRSGSIFRPRGAKPRCLLCANNGSKRPYSIASPATADSPRAPQRRRCWHTPTRRHFHWRLRALWMNLASPLARPLGTRRRPQRRMSLVWESYCATRSRSSLHTEAPIEPLRERPDQSEARQATVGVLQIEAEPLVLHTKLVQSRAPAQADCDGDLPMLVAAVFYRIHQ